MKSDNIMINNVLLKASIICFEREYYNKRNIINPTSEQKQKMRRAMNQKFKKECEAMHNMHKDITQFK